MKQLVPEGVQIFRVGVLTDMVAAVLGECFDSVWVEGEISNLARPASQHIYFSLKDGEATLKAVMYRGIALRLRFDPLDGMSVIARGRLSVYKPRGEYQLLVEELIPKGIGAAELALRQLKERLLAKGYFSPQRKKSLPAYPKRIALIASATGAAIRDMLEILGQRWPMTEVIVRSSRVQGEGAAQEVAAAIRQLNQLHVTRKLDLDAIVIGRGGGSVEDLWAFNEEAVADAIFQSRIPIVSAIGHEIDVTIADLVADRRALTPSEAIIAVTPDQHEIARGLRNARQRLDDGIRHRITLARQRVVELSQRRALKLPLERLREQERRLDEWKARLDRAISVKVSQQQERLAGLVGKLDTLSPLNVLRRGYSLTRSENSGELIASSDQVEPGRLIRTLLSDGQILSRVEAVEPRET